jgi:antitoxin ParD1/3/4/toxin ParE1/3/4
VLEILTYIAEDSPASADHEVARLFRTFEQLAEAPGLGRFRPDLADDRHRFWIAKPYVVAYQWTVTPIRIIAVVHGARSLEAFFEARSESE